MSHKNKKSQNISYFLKIHTKYFLRIYFPTKYPCVSGPKSRRCFANLNFCLATFLVLRHFYRAIFLNLLSFVSRHFLFSDIFNLRSYKRDIQTLITTVSLLCRQKVVRGFILRCVPSSIIIFISSSSTNQVVHYYYCYYYTYPMNIGVLKRPTLYIWECHQDYRLLPTTSA